MRFVTILVLVCGLSVPGVAAEAADQDEAWSDTLATLDRDDHHAFAAVLFTDPHVVECSAELDSLRAEALASVYPDLQAMEAGRHPVRDTSSGIRFIYTVNGHKGMFHHYYSVSRPPFLATAAGRFLVGLACERLVLPDPERVLVSPNGVWHVHWLLTPAEHAEVVSEVAAAVPDAVIALTGEALSRGTYIEIEYVSMEDFEELTGESSN